MEKNKLEGVIIYTNTTCPYCKNIKDLFEKENIEFEERNTSEHQDEWGAILRLTGTPSVPTIEYQGEYFSPGRSHMVGVFQIAADAAYDSGVVSIDSPATGTLTDTETVTVSIFNYGENDISNFDVSTLALNLAF